MSDWYPGGAEWDEFEKTAKRNRMSTDELLDAVREWGRSKGIDNPYRQLNKVTEELGEWAHEICRDNFTTPEAKDACGDLLVTIIVLANICDIDPIECLERAYHEIAGRKGHTSDGMFIKEENA